MITVEDRLRRAAAQLDAAVADRAEGHPYVAPALHSDSGRRRAWLAAAAVVAVLAAALAVVAQSPDGRDTTPADIGGVDAPGWARLPDAPIPGRFQHLAVSTGDGLFVWGGYDDGDRQDGAFYDSTARRWSKAPSAPLAGDRGDAVGAWTGTEVVVVNGIDGAVKAAAYDPARNAWRRLPDPPITNAASMMTKAVVVDGQVVVVNVSAEGEEGVRNEAAVLDPAAGTWRIAAPPPLAFGSGFDAVVVGGEAVVVARHGVGGKSCGEAVVLAYAPGADRWRAIDADPLDAVHATAVVSTGTEVVIAGGLCGDPSGARETVIFDPAADSWRSRAPAPVAIRGDERYPEVWTGTSMVAFDDGGRPAFYTPATDSWHLGEPHPAGRLSETPWAWAGGALTVFSGGLSGGGPENGCCDPVDGAYRFLPSATTP